MLICALCLCMSDIYYNFNINKERFNLHISGPKHTFLQGRRNKVLPSELTPETIFVEVLEGTVAKITCTRLLLDIKQEIRQKVNGEFTN